MTLEFWILFFCLGIIAGFFAGTLGVGGGIVVVPSLYWILKLKGIESSMAMHQSIATSLSVMMITSLSSAITHSLKKGVVWRWVIGVLIGSLLGAFLGPLTSLSIPIKLLKTFLAIFECLIGLYLLLQVKGKFVIKKSLNLRSPWLITLPLGFFVAYLSSLLGIGGGMFFVLAFMLMGSSAHQAIASSTVCIFPISVIATTFYIVFAKQAGFTHAFDVINWKAFLAVSLAAMIAGPIGAHFCYKLSERVLKLIFALFLITLGVLFFI